MRYFILLFLFCPLAQAEHKAHVHGVAKLTIAMENPESATIDLDIPADSIIGFEHKAHTAKDKEAQKNGLNRLQQNQIVQFDPSLACKVTKSIAGMEKEEAHTEDSGMQQGEHSDVNASYTIQCAKPLTGSNIQISLFDLFPRVKSVSVQILGPTNQIQKTVQNSHDTIAIP